MNPDVLVSLIVPAFNAEATIGAAMDSALEQSVRAIEVLVIDDGSADRTAECVERASLTDPRVRLLRTPVNGGPGAARNIGLREARGRWIGPLDADDRLEPDRLSRLIGAAEALGSDMIADDLLVDTDGEATALLGPAPGPWLLTPDRFIRGNTPTGDRSRRQLGFLKPLVRRDFLHQAGVIYPEIYASEDFIFYIRCLAAGARWHVLPEPLYRYVVSPGSLTEQMTTARLRALLAVDDGLLAGGELDANEILRDGLRRHRAELWSAIVWAEWVQSVRAGRPATAARQIVSHPSILVALAEKIFRRMRPQRVEQSSSDRTPLD